MSLLQADARALPIATGSVQCCVTSPPYWGLRDYGTAGQLGLERTPDEYVAAMVGVFREVRRVLRDDGVLWLNLGDSYANTGKSGGGAQGARWAANGGRTEDCKGTFAYAPPGLKPKDLIGIPWRVAFALQADGWYLRSDCIWHKPNPMPESVTDRPTKAHEYVFLLSKAERYYYDAKAISEPMAPESAQRYEAPFGMGAKGKTYRAISGAAVGMRVPTANRNARTVWTIPTQATTGLTGTSRQVRVAWDESDGDTTRITSPDCPVHGGQAVHAAKALCGGRGGGQSANTAHSDSHHAPTPLLDYVPTDQPHDVDSADETTDSSSRSHVPLARPSSTESHRTARVPVTSPACTPSAQTAANTGGTSALRASSDSVGRMHASRTGADSERDEQETSDAQTAARIAGSGTCSCDYYRIESEKIDHFATMPEALARRCILSGSRPGDLVLDPFGGSGTTARVAISLGRRAVSTELNREYLALARDRTHVTRGLPLEVPA